MSKTFYTNRVPYPLHFILDDSRLRHGTRELLARINQLVGILSKRRHGKTLYSAIFLGLCIDNAPTAFILRLVLSIYGRDLSHLPPRPALLKVDGVAVAQPAPASNFLVMCTGQIEFGEVRVT